MVRYPVMEGMRTRTPVEDSRVVGTVGTVAMATVATGTVATVTVPITVQMDTMIVVPVAAAEVDTTTTADTADTTRDRIRDPLREITGDSMMIADRILRDTEVGLEVGMEVGLEVGMVDPLLPIMTVTMTGGGITMVTIRGTIRAHRAMGGTTKEGMAV
jgi:hypothetical protein